MKKSFRNFRGGRAEGEENRKEKKKERKERSDNSHFRTLGCNSGEVHSLAWNVVQIKWAHKKP